MSLKGKRIVVTGASKGLGLGVVRRLCAEGANILAHYNSGDISQARACAEEAGVEFAAFQADLSNIDEVLAMAERINAYEDVYGLVNNAGICLFEDFFPFVLNLNRRSSAEFTAELSIFRPSLRFPALRRRCITARQKAR